MESHQNKNSYESINPQIANIYPSHALTGGGNPLNCDLDKSPTYTNPRYFYESLSQILYYAVIAIFCVVKSWQSTLSVIARRLSKAKTTKQSILAIRESYANYLPYTNLTAISLIRSWVIYFTHCFKSYDLDCHENSLRSFSRNNESSERFAKSRNGAICAILRIALVITNLFYFNFYITLKGIKMQT